MKSMEVVKQLSGSLVESGRVTEKMESETTRARSLLGELLPF